ncbi:MAG: Snf7 family protein [Candidatus Bathyarchaeia archaeon]|nr:hypothetical protein [Candidatus Bathyarchaeota archaeon]
MSTRDLFKAWEKGTGLLKKQPPLKERIGKTIYRLKIQKDKLEMAATRMQKQDRNLFEKCVEAQLAKDPIRAAMYANECAEIRKMLNIMLRAQLAIEQAILRLETVQEFGDVVAVMAPVASVVNVLKTQLSGIIPEVSYELGAIGEELNGIVAEVGEATGRSWEIEAASEEARQILEKAAFVAEQKMKEALPEIPSTEVPSKESANRKI